MEYRDFVRMKNLIVSDGSQTQAVKPIKDCWKAASRWAAGNILLKNYPDFESIEKLKETSSFSVFLDRAIELCPVKGFNILRILKNNYDAGINLLNHDKDIRDMVVEIETISINDFLKPKLEFNDKYLTSSLAKIGVECNISKDKMVFKLFSREIVIDYEYKDKKFHISKASDNYGSPESFACLKGTSIGMKELRSILNCTFHTSYYLKTI